MERFCELDLIDESKTLLAKVLKSKGDSMMYIYDFGDNWRHNVVLEAILPASDAVKTPICLGGERRCPPEDVGGVSDYAEFVEVIFDPSHEDYEHHIRWAGGHFIDTFDALSVNAELQRMRWPVRHRY